MSTAEEPQVRPGLLIGLGVIVGLAGLYALWTFVVSPLLTDDTEDPTPAVVQQDDAATDGDAPQDDAAAPDDGPTEAPDPFAGLDGEPVPETFEIFTARDPFQQLVVEADSGAATVVAPEEGAAVIGSVAADVADAVAEVLEGDDGQEGSGETAGSGNDDGINTQSAPASRPAASTQSTSPQQTSPQPAPAPAAPAEDADAPAEPEGTRIMLRDRFAGTDTIPTMIVSVDGITYEVREGDVFAERLQVLSIDETCATFLFGDSRFVLCEGESIVK